ncbi:nuclear transport factor 2 family protein [Microbacterium sp. NPDC076895]|uniref:nuclear transport factor 2 family protein n=1 Tax=Microbacterium sp. NPDC076895 TaxID=3154957 RepID=UPI00343ED5E1
MGVHDDGTEASVDRLVREYLASLEAADADRVIALFAPGGIVESPLYGTMPAAEFYPALFADTASSRLTLRTTMTGSTEGRAVVSFWFDFDWTLSTGEPAPFTVVDVAELDEHGLIERLHIVYDTHPIRDAFNNAHDGEN